MSSGQQLVHSEYLQLLTALAVGLGLHHVLVSPPHPPHFPPLPPAKEWKWLSNFTQALKISEAFNKRTHLPKDTFSLPKDMEPLDPSEKYQTTVSLVIGHGGSWLPCVIGPGLGQLSHAGGEIYKTCYPVLLTMGLSQDGCPVLGTGVGLDLRETGRIGQALTSTKS